MIQTVLSVAVYVTAGTCFFFILFNRFILPMKQGLAKSLISYSGMVLCTVGPALFRTVSGRSRYFLVPLIFLLFCLIVEVYRRIMQAVFRKELPVSLNKIHGKHDSLNTTNSLVVNAFRVNTMPWKNKNLRIVQLSDFHIDHHFPAAFYEACFRELTELNPDIIFLTGDYTDEPDSLQAIIPLLRRVKFRYGLFGVLGNHDYWVDADKIRNILSESGVEILSDTCRIISIFERYHVKICGVETPYSPKSLLEIHKQNGIPIIVLSHTPDNIFKLSRMGADFVFSGHLHGGQWRFPILGAIVCPSIHGRLFDYGHFQVKKTHLFVTSGIGAIWIPLRISCKPEILVVDLYGG